MHPLAPLPKVFVEKKARILSQLAVPMALYGDLSPKGSIDDGIRDLIDGINARDGLVTTSSCAGRVVVFAEGAKRGEVMVTMETEKERHGDVDEGEDEGKGDVDGCQVEVEKTQALKGGKMNLARAGGKGGGGKWLFVSHEPVDMEDSKRDGVSSFLGMPRMEGVVEHGRPFTEERLIHFKFEPMVRGRFILCVRNINSKPFAVGDALLCLLVVVSCPFYYMTSYNSSFISTAWHQVPS